MLWILGNIGASAAAPPTLLKDIGRMINPNSSDPVKYMALGTTGVSVFFAKVSEERSALCRTDGTSAGTFILNVFPYNKSTAFTTFGDIAPLGASAIFSRRSAGNGWGGTGDDWELWRTDGTVNGTTRIKAVSGMDETSFFRSVPTQLTTLGGRVIMRAYTAESGEEIWVTDGTEEGTRMLHDINPGPKPRPFEAGSTPLKDLTASGGLVYFSADDGESGEELWITDGTPSGTVRLKDLNPGEKGSQPGGFMESRGLTYFTANGKEPPDYSSPEPPVCEVWRTDGTSGGTIRLMELSGTAKAGGFYPVGATTIFIRPTRLGTSLAGNGVEIPGQFFQTDGTPDGTIPGPELPGSSFAPYALLGVSAKDNLLYQAWGKGNDWGVTSMKEGTFSRVAGGSSMIHAFHAAGWIGQMMSSDGTLSLHAYNADTGVSSPVAGLEADGVTGLASSGGLLIANYRGPYGARSGNEPWLLQADGTTLLLGDLYPGSTVASGYAGPEYGPYAWNYTKQPFLLRGTLVFPAFGDTGTEIWKSDGTGEGTTVLKDIIPGTTGHSSIIDRNSPTLALKFQVGQSLYFIRILAERPYGSELWVTDGTEAGTVKICQDQDNSINGILPWTGGVWWVQLGRTNADSNTVWLSDGTSGGTRPVKNIVPHPDGNGLSACFNGTTYTFLTKNGSTGSLWEIHPDASRIRPVFEFVKAGESQVVIRDMRVFKGCLYFFLRRQGDFVSQSPRGEIWRMEPGGSPQLMLAMPAMADFSDILPGTHRLFFNATAGGLQQASLWVTDGTAGGTRRATPPDSTLHLDNYRIASAVAGDRLFIAHDGDEAGYELWTNDGTPESTRRLTGQIPAADGLSSGGRPRQIINGGDGYVYFDNETITGNQPVRRIWRVSAVQPAEPEAFGELPENQIYGTFPDGNIYYLPHTLFRAHDRLYASCITSGGGHEFYWWPAPSPLTPYSTWAAGQGLNLGPADPLADPDADGQPNLLEFLTGSLPGSAASVHPPAVNPYALSGSSQALMSFRRMENTGMTLTVESSLDAFTWNSDHIFAPDGSVTSSPDALRRSNILSRNGTNPEVISIVTLPGGNHARILLRVRAVLPENN